QLCLLRKKLQQPTADRESVEDPAAQNAARRFQTGLTNLPPTQFAPARPNPRQWACACRDSPSAPVPNHRSTQPWNESRSLDEYEYPPGPGWRRTASRLQSAPTPYSSWWRSPLKFSGPWTSWDGGKPARASRRQAAPGETNETGHQMRLTKSAAHRARPKTHSRPALVPCAPRLPAADTEKSHYAHCR